MREGDRGWFFLAGRQRGNEGSEQDEPSHAVSRLEGQVFQSSIPIVQERIMRDCKT